MKYRRRNTERLSWVWRSPWRTGGTALWRHLAPGGRQYLTQASSANVVPTGHTLIIHFSLPGVSAESVSVVRGRCDVLLATCECVWSSVLYGLLTNWWCVCDFFFFACVLLERNQIRHDGRWCVGEGESSLSLSLRSGPAAVALRNSGAYNDTQMGSVAERAFVSKETAPGVIAVLISQGRCLIKRGSRRHHYACALTNKQ